MHNSALIIDCRKFTTKITLSGISSFNFYHWTQSHSPCQYSLYAERTPKFLDTSDVDDALHGTIR